MITEQLALWTNRTFPTVSPCTEWIGCSAMTHMAELILDGNFQPHDINPLAQALINQLTK